MIHRALSRRSFFWFIVLVVLFGFFIFSSAALGLLSRGGASYGRVMLNQLVILLIALAVMIVTAKIDYHHWRRFAAPVLLISLVLTLLVFVPGLGFASGGARRWILIASHTFQPSEFLKLGFIIYLAAWLTRPNAQLTSWRSGLLSFLLLTALVGAILVAQPDLGTLLTLLLTAVIMFFVAGGRLAHLSLIFLLGLIALSVVIAVKPYARDRILTFLNPTENVLTTSYQINQSLIAIGSGGLFGRGFGRSIQKFQYLPEPIGDSIFAVAAEEFGFIGSLLIVAIFVVFTLWGLRLATRALDRFGRILIVGITLLVVTGAFINISSMLGLIPLTGIPLIFISHGGSSLLFSLIGSGIILNVARQKSRARI